MEIVPASLALLFGASALFSVILCWKSANYSKPLILVILFWIGFQSALGIRGFYLDSSSFPPKIALLVAPAFLTIFLLFLLPKGRSFVHSLNPETLCLIHTVRIPVEIGLYGLFLNHLVPADMTFEGGNFDLFSGISAPFVFWFGYRKKQLNRFWLVTWNVVCLFLLLNVVSKGILSAPSAIQQLNFDQPNQAVLHFPVNLLPAVIVPLVLFSHLTLLVKK